MLIDFYQRKNTPEIIDGNEYTVHEYLQWLKQLSVVNHLTQSCRFTVQNIEQLLKTTKTTQAITLLDLGCGGGDTIIEILRWNHKKKYPLRVMGLDNNPHCLDFLNKRLKQENLTAELILGDGLEFIKTHQVDIVINSLFTHHLNDTQIVALLAFMSNHVNLGFVINDLHRHWLPYLMVWAGSRLAGGNRLLKYDGPISVTRGFKKQEWLDYCTKANIPLKKIAISWHWSFRYSILYNNVV